MLPSGKSGRSRGTVAVPPHPPLVYAQAAVGSDETCAGTTQSDREAAGEQSQSWAGGLTFNADSAEDPARGRPG